MKFCALIRKKIAKNYLHRYEIRGKRNRRLKYICELLKLKFYQ